MGRHSAEKTTPTEPTTQPRLVPPRPAGGQAGVGLAGVFDTLSRRILAGFLLAALVGTLVALAVQWPSGDRPPVSAEFESRSSLSGALTDGTVALVQPGPCNSPAQGQVFDKAPANQSMGANSCTVAIVDLNSGSDSGKRTLLEVHPELPGNPDLRPGDKITLSSHKAAGQPTQYAFQDFQRTAALWIWLAVALILIVVVGAWRGLRSIIGLAVTLTIVVLFLIPGLTHGGSAVPLAATTGAAVLFFVLFLVHGVNWKTASAMGGTLLSLGLSVILSWLAVTTTGIRGLGNENNLNILVYLPTVSISGLMLAGMILGSLGVLNDVTIAQASTVNELHELDPHASRWHLFRSAMKVGRDHIASMVYTLILSYTGVALPTLLLLSVSGRPLEQVLTSDVMATEILRSVSGAIALVLAVPATTIIAAFAALPHRVRAGASVPASS